MRQAWQRPGTGIGERSLRPSGVVIALQPRQEWRAWE
jgi:hypothetical protein